MAGTASKINIKNIDYFKYKKILIDGNRDDYSQCSREVRAMCDSVQTLAFRDDEFDDATDRRRFQEINMYYRQILSGKRIDPVDLRVKNGWWVDNSSGVICSAGKFKTSALKETLVTKTKEWMTRRGTPKDELELNDKIEGPGLYVFKHKERQCFQQVTRAEKIFQKSSDFLKAAFDGRSVEPLAALLVISMASDWDFYFISVETNEIEEVARVLENDVIIRHDSIWPHGLNQSLHISTPIEIAEFRKSCLRHRWPPETETVDEGVVDIVRLRKQISSFNEALKSNPPMGEDSLQTAKLTEIENRDEMTSSILLNGEAQHNSVETTSTIQTNLPKSKAKLNADKSVQPSSPTPKKPSVSSRPLSAPKQSGLKSPKPSSRPRTGSETKKISQSHDPIGSTGIPSSTRQPSRISVPMDHSSIKYHARSADKVTETGNADGHPPVDAEEYGSGNLRKLERSRSAASVSSVDSKKEEEKIPKETTTSGASDLSNKRKSLPQTHTRNSSSASGLPRSKPR